MTSLTTKLVISPAAKAAASAMPSSAIRVGGTGCLHTLADRSGLPALQQRLVGLLLDIVVAIDLGELGFDLGHELSFGLELGVLRLIGVDFRLKRRDFGLGVGKRDSQLLENRIATHCAFAGRAGFRGGFGARLDVLAALLLELFDDPLGAASISGTETGAAGPSGSRTGASPASSRL